MSVRDVGTSVQDMPPIDQVMGTDEYQHFIDTANLAFAKVDQIQDAVVQLEKLLGFPLARLSVSNSSSLVDAINTEKSRNDQTRAWIGDIATLTTADKQNVVAAVNRVNRTVGATTELETQEKTTIVLAMNEVLELIKDLEERTPDSENSAPIKTADTSTVGAGVDEGKAITPKTLATIPPGSPTAKGLVSTIRSTSDSAATNTRPGLTMLATQTSVDTGTSGAVSVTPMGLKNVGAGSPTAEAIAHAVFKSIPRYTDDEDTDDVPTTGTVAAYWNDSYSPSMLFVWNEGEGKHVGIGAEHTLDGSIRSTDAFADGAKATESKAGVVKRSSQAVTNSGTDRESFLSPGALASAGEGSELIRAIAASIAKSIPSTSSVDDLPAGPDEGGPHAAWTERSDGSGGSVRVYVMWDEELEKYTEISGAEGPQGARGLVGARGPEGPEGPQGVKGDTGSQGVKGDTGDEGPEGPAGPAGDPPEHGWSGTQLRFRQSDGSWGMYTNLRGPQGDQGVEGPPGDSSTSATVAQQQVEIDDLKSRVAALESA